jgi:hypothetical protein
MIGNEWLEKVGANVLSSFRFPSVVSLATSPVIDCITLCDVDRYAASSR